MSYYKMGKIEFQFATIIWENAPLRSSELARLALDKLDWKKSTTYTVLKKLADRGLFKNDRGLVTCLISLDEYYSMQLQGIIDEGYEGSLPKFIAAFTKTKHYSDDEINDLVDQIKKME